MQETVAHPGVAQGAGVDSVIDMLHNPLTFYQTAPVPGELDMVALVRQRLIDYGKKDIIEAVFDNSRHIREAIGKNSHAQQFHIVRWLQMQFSSLEIDTREIRFGIIYELSPAEFMVCFEQSLLPALIHHNLPVQIA